MSNQLDESEARWRSLLEHANDLIVVTDAAGNVIYSSPAVERLVGASTQSHFEQLLADFVEPGEVTRLSTLWHAICALPGAQCDMGECRVRAVDGTWRSLSGTLINQLADSAVQGVVIRAYDISRQEQAAETLEQSIATEQRQARELAALNTAFQAMASSLELNLVLAAVTREIQRLIGAESVSVLLRDGDDLEFAAVAGPGAETLIGMRMPAASGLAGAVLQHQAPLLVADVQTDARFYPGIDIRTGQQTRSLLAVPLRGKDAAIGVMEAMNKSAGHFVAHDLDLMQAIAGSAVIAIENARLYETLRAHHRWLQAAQPRLVQTEKMAALGRLTASLAHEINNPLQVVQGCHTLIGEMLNDANLTDAQKLVAIRADLAMAVSEVERMATLMRRLRDFYQPMHTPAPSADVHVVLETVLSLTRQSIVRQHIIVDQHISWDEGESGPTAAVAADHLKHILLNLVFYAIDNMPYGGRLGIHATRAEFRRRNGVQNEAGVQIDIHDTGPAIPAESLPHVFEPFHAVRTTDSGLSLSICYELVTSIGGEITIASAPDSGTTFTVWLPIATV